MRTAQVRPGYLSLLWVMITLIWLWETDGLAVAQDAVLRGGLYANGYQTVPVLVYNPMADAEDDKAGPSDDRFARQMAFLNDKGYRVVTLQDAVSFMEYHGSLPLSAVVLTFDGGRAGLIRSVVPVLQKYRFSATFFVPAGHIGTPGYLTWPQLRELVNQGFDIQNQGMLGRDLTNTKGFKTPGAYFDFVHREIRTAHQLIHDEVGIVSQFFAYPVGKSNRLIIAILEKLNYRAGLTLETGGNPFFQPRFAMKRNAVDPADDLGGFEAKLAVFHEQALE